MSVEELPLLKEFKTYLQATLVAFGSEGAPFSLVNQRFSEDWVGSPSLKEYSAKLGFGGSKGVMKLLESIPDQVTIVVNPTGEVVLKPVPMEETRDNLAKIDETNKELKADKMRRQQYHGPLPPDVIAQLAASVMPVWPPPVPAHPLASVFNASIRRTPATASIVGPPPPLPTKKINPNLIPLGPPRFARCASTSNIASSADGSVPSVSATISFPKQQPQRLMTFYGQRKPQPAAVCNDFGDVLASAAPSHPTTAPSATEQPEKSPQKADTNVQNKTKKMTFEQAMRYMERETWKKAEKRSDAYYEEDFRASASPRFGSPDPRPPKELHANRQSVCEVEKCEKPMNEVEKTGMKAKVLDDKSSSSANNKADNDEDDSEETADDSENDWDFLDGILDHDDWQEDDDNKECDAFLYQFQQIYNKPIPESIYRLVHIFRLNDGSFSKIDLLEKKYLDTYGTRLNSTERNRLLGAPAATRIVKDSFLKAAYAGFFRVSERKSNCYGVNLFPCLAGKFVDPSVFLSAVTLSIRPSTSVSIPSPVQMMEKLEQQPLPNDNSHLTQFNGQKIESILSAYADLIESLREPPLSPPFSVGQLVLFRHDKLGMCRGKVMRQDSQHLAVKHLDTPNEHYVKIDAIYAFPDQLLAVHSTKARPCSKMASHPGATLNFVVPIIEQQFRCY